MIQNKSVNLFIALGKFIKEIRRFIIESIIKTSGDSWEEFYRNSLYDNQKKEWDNLKTADLDPAQLIDFGNLGNFAQNQKDFLWPYFKRNTNKLPTWFRDIAEARNRTLHFQDWDDDVSDIAFVNMIRIAKILGLEVLEKDLRNLKGSEIIPIQKGIKDSSYKTTFNNKDEIIRKADAIELVNNHLGSRILSQKNVSYSKIINGLNWWLNIPQKKFEVDLHLLLANSDGGLIWIKIPGGRYKEPDKIFRIRRDNKKVDLRISAEPGLYYLRDLNSEGISSNFKPFVEKEFSNPQ